MLQGSALCPCSLAHSAQMGIPTEAERRLFAYSLYEGQDLAYLSQCRCSRRSEIRVCFKLCYY